MSSRDPWLVSGLWCKLGVGRPSCTTLITSSRGDPWLVRGPRCKFGCSRIRKSGDPSAMAQPPSSDCCSICHDRFNIPCQANCSHWFCSSCILQVWHHGLAVHPCKCPLCRRPITLLIPAESSQLQQSSPEASRVMREIETYNRVFGERSTDLYQRFRDLPFLLRRLLQDLLDPGRSLPVVIKARVYLAMFLSVIYLFSPVDIIPEGVLGVIGLLDDFIILLVCFLHVAAIYRSVLVSRHNGS